MNRSMYRSLVALVASAGLLVQSAPSRAQTTPPHGAASRPATTGPIGKVGPEVLRAQATFILEIDEKKLRAQESWQIQNPSNGAVPASALVFGLGNGTSKVALDENTPGFELREGDDSVRASQDLGPGMAGFGAAYFIEKTGGSVTLNRTFPVMTQGRIILPSLDGVRLETSMPTSMRTRELDGIVWQIYEYTDVVGPVRLTLTGLPTPATWPRDLMLVLCGLAVVWMVVSLLRTPKLTPAPITVASAETRREQLLRAIELLEQDRRDGVLDGARFANRRKALLAELAQVLAELERPR